MKKEKKVFKKRKNNFFKNSIFIPFILLIAALIILAFSPLFDITNTKIEGNLRLTENTILNVSGIKLGQNILRINKTEIKRNIETLPYIDKVSIKRNWPDTLFISIKEKEAIAKISTIGAILTLDEDGNVLNSFSDNTVIDLPLIDKIEVFSYGFDLLNTSDNEKINNILEVLKIFEKNGMLRLVEKIEQDSNIVIYTKEGHVANIGDINDLEYKIKRVKAVIEKETSEKYYFDISNINIYPISKPLWTLTEDKQDIEVVE